MATIAPKEKKEVLILTNEWIQKGQRMVITRLLTTKLGRIPAPLRRRIDRLSPYALEEMPDALLNFKSIKDVEKWVGQHL